MTHIMRIEEMINHQRFNDIPSLSNKQRAKNVGIQKCYDILNSEQAQDILKKYGVTLWKTKENIVLYIPTKRSNNDYTDVDKTEMIMQNCIYELDCKTELHFNIAMGRPVYGVTAFSTNSLMDECKYDFQRYYGMRSALGSLLSKGYNFIVEYVFHNYGMKIKCYTKSSDILLDEIKEDILKYAKDYIKRKHPEYSIELEYGKRGNDTNREEYESFIVYHGSSSNIYNQIGGFDLYQNKFGDVSCHVHIRVDDGTSEFNINNWKSEIESTIDDIIKWE